MSTSEAFLQIFAYQPDPNEPLPISNRPETIYGAVVPFLIISWCAICMRIYVRSRIMRDLGWDDLFVVLAACSNTAASALVLYCEYNDYMAYTSTYTMCSDQIRTRKALSVHRKREHDQVPTGIVARAHVGMRLRPSRYSTRRTHCTAARPPSSRSPSFYSTYASSKPEPCAG